MEISGDSGLSEYLWKFLGFLGFSGFLDIPSFFWVFMDISDFSGSSSKTGEGGATKI